MQDANRAASLYNKTIKYIFLLLFLIVLVIVTFANEGLNLWLGNEFADNSTLVLQILAIGVFLNAHAKVSFGLVQSVGRPDLTAKLHLAELPFYLLVLWWLLNTHGITGVALAWLLRVTVDTAVLFIMANRLVPTVSGFTWRVFYTAGIALTCLILAAVIPDLTIRWLFLILTFLFFVIMTWFYVLSDYERGKMYNLLK